MIKGVLKKTRLYPWLGIVKANFDAVLWSLGIKRSESPPALIKRSVLKSYAKKFKPSVFIETGTYLGDTVATMKNIVSKIHSIELSEELAGLVRKRFLKYQRVNIHQGDSAIILPQILGNISGPCLFWLDAHCSAGITVGNDTQLPLMKEIKAILEHWQTGSVILIDDARLMGKQNGYPSFEEIKNLVESFGLGLKIIVELDIIRIHA